MSALRTPGRARVWGFLVQGFFSLWQFEYITDGTRRPFCCIRRLLAKQHARDLVLGVRIEVVAQPGEALWSRENEHLEMRRSVFAIGIGVIVEGGDPVASFWGRCHACRDAVTKVSIG
jgi:hypothetical protein